MVLRHFTTSLLIAAFLGSAQARAAETANANLRYSLTPGRELTYHTDTVSKKNGVESSYLVDWKFWVVGREPDGSWRLVIRCDLSMKSGTGTKTRDDVKVDTLVWRCRLFDDGRIIGATTMGTVRDPFRIFPRLPDGPKDLELGWVSAGSEKEGVTLHHRLTPDAPAGGDVVSITTRAEGPEDKVYLASHSTKAAFDVRRGAVTRVETEDRSERLNPGMVTQGVIELVAIEDRGDEWAATLGKEADLYFGALDAYDGQVRQAKRDAAHCGAILADAKAKLEVARKAITLPGFRNALSQRLSEHDRSVSYLSEQASDHAARLGKPAAAWEAVDVDGKPHRLEDYRGKVVVMDFWYRNCGWCIHAMPQVVRLAKAFRDQPVAVLGMCIDEKEEDARAVIDAMGLEYPTIKAAGIPEKCGVEGYPTLVVLDPKGVVREIHVGYSDRLFDELSDQIRKLLAESPSR